MKTLGTRMPRAGVPRPNGRAPLLLCLLMFGLVAVVVYRWGSERVASPAADLTFTATAYVVQESSKTGREAGIPLSWTDDSPKRAEDAANALAAGYAADRRLQWKHRMEEPCRKAHQMTERAYVEYAACEALLDAVRGEAAEADLKPQTASKEQTAARPMIDNPEWIELEGQIQQLEQRRDNLLVDRTPMHPAVLEVAQRIEDMKRQMAAMPRQIPGKVVEGAAVSEPALVAQSAAETNQATLVALTATVEMARELCREAEVAEKRAIPVQIASPNYEVLDAEVVENQSPVDSTGWRLLGTTLVAGALMAFGVGAVSAGASIHPPVGTVAQVERAARVPVVGTIPADHPVSDPRRLSGRRTRARRALLAAGLLLMAACPAAAVWGVLGI